jgi:leader peptidase (prepilin peptidase)/N-methyltransferase
MADYMEDWFFGHPLFLVFVFMIGACVGSFLNVVIYRVPRNMGVSDPKRSFCPKCKKDIPGYRNIPVITWIIQLGKCAECRAPIAFRYCFVEILTGVLFLAAFLLFDPVTAFFVVALLVILISVGFIDAELMIIPMGFCWWGMAIGLAGSVLASSLVLLPVAGQAMPSWQGGLQGLLGLAFGWGLLLLVVRGGKMLFGSKKMNFSKAQEWYLREPESDEEQLCFVINTESKKGAVEEEMIPWGDLFFRPSDRLEVTGHGIHLDGKATKATEVIIRADRVEINGEEHMIEKIASLSGKAERVVIPREAMGSGDPPLLGMIGAFIGWQGVLFTVFSSCIYAIVAAILGRVGFGRALPFGPFLALGAVTWVFGGWKLWEAYFAFVEGVGQPMP